MSRIDLVLDSQGFSLVNLTSGPNLLAMVGHTSWPADLPSNSVRQRMEFEGPLQGQQYALGGKLLQLRIQNEMEDNHGQRACLSMRW